MQNKNFDLWMGDCLELMKNIPDKSINLILADLPYKQLASKWDKPIDLSLLWIQYNGNRDGYINRLSKDVLNMSISEIKNLKESRQKNKKELCYFYDLIIKKAKSKNG